MGTLDVTTPPTLPPSSPPPPPPPPLPQPSASRLQRRACVIINQLAFPGLGTIVARRKEGWAQAALMVAGFILSVGFLLWYLYCVGRILQHPEWSETQFKSAYRPYRW